MRLVNGVLNTFEVSIKCIEMTIQEEGGSEANRSDIAFEPHALPASF